MTIPLTTRSFLASELIAPANIDPRIVCTPDLGEFRGTEADVAEWVERRREALLDTVHREGALLLRDFPIGEPERFEAVLLALDLDLDVSYQGGASPRRRVTKQTWTSTEVPSPFMIAYHTEMCYLRHRPRYIAFYCDLAPKRYGETVIFDGAAAWDNLSDAVRRMLETHGVRYRRYFPARRKRLLPNFYVPWRDAFGVQEPKQLEELLHQDGTSFQWLNDGSVETEKTVPAVMREESAGRACLSVSMYDEFSLVYNVDRFGDRYAPLARFLVRRFVKMQASRKHMFLRTLRGDGQAFSREQCHDIQRAAWDASVLFRWRKGDLLLLDNIRMGHGRMNIQRPRRIVAALANLYDVSTRAEDTLSA
jgi:alpha-ketoglutarate-dependent taurine dioxygenase